MRERFPAILIHLLLPRFPWMYKMDDSEEKAAFWYLKVGRIQPGMVHDAHYVAAFCLIFEVSWQ